MSKTTRGHYRKSYVSKRSNRGGYRYVRAVPLEFQELEGKKNWSHDLGHLSLPAAEARGVSLTDHYNKHLAHLKRLPAETRAEIIAAPSRLDGKLAGKIREITKAKSISPIDAWNALTAYEHGKLDAFTTKSRDAEQQIDPLLPDDAKAALLLSGYKIKTELETTKKSATQKMRVLKAIRGETEDKPKLFNLIALYFQKRKPRAKKTRQKTELYVRRFVDVIGVDLAANEVTRDHARQFCEHLEANNKITFGTINLHLEKLHALFNVALAANIVAANPFAKIKATERQFEVDDPREKKQPFTGKQVALILATPPVSEDFALITKILAYHGCRSGEVCQLMCEDFAVFHGVPAFKFHRKYGKTLKNKPSERTIPVHPKLLAEIQTHAARVEKEFGSSSWLFPSLKTRDGDRVHDFTLRVGRWLRNDVGISARSLTIHGLRHTFSTCCREIEMPEVYSRSLEGHTLGQGEHAKYGKGPSLRALLKWLEKIDPLAC
jgi:integrase